MLIASRLLVDLLADLDVESGGDHRKNHDEEAKPVTDYTQALQDVPKD